MVAVKTSDSNHNFDTDPIEIQIDGDYITANGTTLGADNGIGVATALAILDDESIEHVPLVVILTTGEEVNMIGAEAIDLSNVHADYLLNLDSEDEGIIIIGCIGAVDVEFTYDKDLTDTNNEYLKVELKDFDGGHSGLAVGDYKLNASKGLARLLYGLEDFEIAEIKGGAGMKNAVSSSAHAIIAVSDKKKARTILDKTAAELKNEFSLNDPNGHILVEDASHDGQVMSKGNSKNLVDLILHFPDGVYKAHKGALISSSNLGVIEDEGDVIRGVSMLRDDYESELKFNANMIKDTCEKYGARAEIKNIIPGWEREDSELVEIARNLAEKEYGHDVITITVHGTLEPAFLKREMPETPMISVGPIIEDVHTPKEKANIPSTLKFWDYMKELLKELA